MKFKLAVSLFCILIALSALGSGLKVTGGLFEKDVVPGEHIQHTIIIGVNEDAEATEATAGIYGYGMGLDGSRVPLEDTDEMKPFSASGFLNISPESAIVKPGEPATFVVEGTVPEDVGSGGRYALVEIHTPPKSEEGKQIGIALAAIVPVRLTISVSELIEVGEITNLTAFENNGSVIFKNTGNHHYMARSEATIKDDKGNVIASAAAPLMYTSLVPTASWLFRMKIESEKDLEHGTYTVEAKVIDSSNSTLDSKEESFSI